MADKRMPRCTYPGCTYDALREKGDVEEGGIRCWRLPSTLHPSVASRNGTDDVPCITKENMTDGGLIYLQSFETNWLSGLQSTEKNIACYWIFALGSHACQLEDELASLNRKLASAQS